jgi:hypothetical protein
VRTILFVSADAQLAARISAALSHGECILRLAPLTSVLAPMKAWHNVIVVADCRGLSRAETERTIVRIRSLNRDAFRCVALVSGAPERTMDVIGRAGTSDFDVVLSAHDHVGSTLCAILNDADQTVGAAIALEALRKHLAVAATTIAEAVLSSGCRVSSVGAVETALDTDRGALGRDLADEGSPMPKAVIRVVRATYAVVLLRRTTLTLGKIAERIGYSAGRWVQDLLVSEFSARAEELRDRDADMPIEEFSDELLLTWKAEAKQTGRQAGRQAGDLGNL